MAGETVKAGVTTMAQQRRRGLVATRRTSHDCGGKTVAVVAAVVAVLIVMAVMVAV